MLCGVRRGRHRSFHFPEKFSARLVPTRRSLRPQMACALVGLFLLRDVRHRGDDFRPRRRGSARVQLPDCACRLRRDAGTPDFDAAANRLGNFAAGWHRRSLRLYPGRFSFRRRDRLHLWRAAYHNIADRAGEAASDAGVAQATFLPVHSFHYRDGELYCEEVALARAAEEFGTPLYVYSAGTILDHYRRLNAALAPLDHLICYAVKANSNGAILKLLAEAGAAFDIVSGGELFRVLRAGGTADKCTFAGVGKSREEIEYALDEGVFSFNVESEAELEWIDH